jgi:hypothetical protein
LDLSQYFRFKRGIILLHTLLSVKTEVQIMPDRLKTPLASIAQHEKIRTKKARKRLMP